MAEGGQGRGPLPLGQITGEYLVLSGVARFLVEFIRINPRIYWGMSNAQVASLGSIAAGILLVLWARRHSGCPRGCGRSGGCCIPSLTS